MRTATFWESCNKQKMTKEDRASDEKCILLIKNEVVREIISNKFEADLYESFVEFDS